MADNFSYCHENAIPFMVLFGEEEVKAGVVKIKVRGHRGRVRVGYDGITGAGPEGNLSEKSRTAYSRLPHWCGTWCIGSEG